MNTETQVTHITLDEGALDHIPFVQLARFLAQYDCRFERLPTNELRIIHVPPSKTWMTSAKR